MKSYRGLANRRLQPLGHLSDARNTYSSTASPSNFAPQIAQTTRTNANARATKRGTVAAAILVLLLAAPAHAQTQSGIASTYSYGPTACGDRKLRAMSAAHRSLPCNTRVRVTRKGGRSVTVTIRDRGPFIRGRIIDLSPDAASALGMGYSIAPVTIEVVR
jgi:rare lipoprotein A